MHAMIYVLLFLIVYAAVIVFMLRYYIDSTGVDFFYGRKLDPPIAWGQEVTFILCLGLLGVGFLLLERFIKLYATTLLDRSKKIQTLEIEKEELVQEIKKYKDERADIDLDAPLQKVITTLQNISGDLGVNSAIKDQLSFVIKILASNKLYAPNLEDKRNFLLAYFNI